MSFPADVLLASSSEQLCDRWRHLVRRALVIHELGARSELLRAVSRIKPDLVLLDLTLIPARVRAVRALHNASPTTKIIAFAGVTDDREGVGVLRAGARGYCDRHADGRLLEGALSAVQHGKSGPSAASSAGSSPSCSRRRASRRRASREWTAGSAR